MLRNTAVKRTFMPEFQTTEDLRAYQRKGLQWTVAHAYNGSPAYKKKMDDAGVSPADIKRLDDLSRLPFTTADDIRAGYPFPLLCVPEESVVRIHASTGSTGKRKVLAYTQKDIDDWVHFFARCYETAELTCKDRVQICVGYGIWTAGFGFQVGCERFGAMALPLGPGNTEMQCEALVDFGATVMCSTASMALLMAEEIERRGIRDQIRLKKLIFGSERSSVSIRKRIKELMGLEDMFDIPGMTELYGPGTGLECPKHEGIHYWADYYILEILDPETLQPVKDGEVGEMVVTTLKKEAVPLIRYRTRDLTRKVDRLCSCGSIMPLHDRILGRTDDMIIFRAVNFYPGQVDQILSAFPELGSEFQIILDRREDGREIMTIKVERDVGRKPQQDANLQERIEREIKGRLMVTPRVEIVSYGALPRSERKSKRVFDHRG
jgi:phenylacetate-CoA ligase